MDSMPLLQGGYLAATARLVRRHAIAFSFGGGSCLVFSALCLLLWHERGWPHDGQTTPLPSLGAELRFLAAPELVRAGPARLAVVTLGRAAQFVPHAFAEEGLVAPVSIETWAQLLRAPIVFNAGQFDEHFRHLGWLRSRSRWLEPVRKGSFKGLLVSGPLAPLWPAAGPHPLAHTAIVDLEETDVDIANAYGNVVQSMMLVDNSSEIRVRRSELAACRTVVAENRSGELLIIVSEGAIVLHELAAWLPSSSLQVVRAINLDGGTESQLAIDNGSERFTLIGRYGHDSALGVRPSVAPAPLPAVIAVYPR